MQVVPLSPVPSQTFTVALGVQRCQISVYQKPAFEYDVATVAQYLTDSTGNYITTAGGLKIVAGYSSQPILINSVRIYLDLYLNDALLIGGSPCLTGQPIVMDEYLGFAGDLVFYDTQGLADPIYSGLGSRWFLAYLVNGQ